VSVLPTPAVVETISFPIKFPFYSVYFLRLSRSFEVCSRLFLINLSPVSFALSPIDLNELPISSKNPKF
jgi:hypothetical protein